MADAQNERTNGRNRRRRPRRRRGPKPAEMEPQQQAQREPEPESMPESTPPPPTPAQPDAPEIRPEEIAAPTIRSEEYCVHHMGSFREEGPMEVRTRMTTLRHLQVDHFGEATLFCDCLHNGPHEWPPSMQRLETAIELDQFLADSTSEA